MGTSENKKTKNKKGWIIALIATIIIVVVISFNYKYLKAYYYFNKNNNFSVGDKMYANDLFLQDTAHRSIFLHRLTQSNSGYDLYLTSKQISSDSLNKYKNNYISTYLGYKLLPVTFNGKSGITPLYIIQPNWKMVEDDHLPDTTSHKFVDNKYYIIGTHLYIK
jgi:hypothetical protein